MTKTKKPDHYIKLKDALIQAIESCRMTGYQGLGVNNQAKVDYVLNIIDACVISNEDDDFDPNLGGAPKKDWLEELEEHDKRVKETLLRK